MTVPVPLAACAGLFLLPTHATLGLVRSALDRAERVVVFLRRARMAPGPANPFGWEERAHALRDALAEDERARVTLVPLREPYDDTVLLQAMVAATGAGPVLWVHGGTPPVDPGDLPPGWSLAQAAAEDPDAATVCALRTLYLASEPGLAMATVLADLAPVPQARLHSWMATDAYATARDDWRQIDKEQRAWSVAPYPVVLVTVDVVVRAQDRVLLVQRGRSPGKGNWAVPGGFLEPAEGVLDAALRELAEETGLALPRRDRLAALRARQVFDHPQRSERGRVITHAFFFDLPGAAPAVQGGDDAAAARWVPLAELPGLEDRLHDDHFHILSTFLGLVPQPL